mgnify:CR=1 FL=1
MKRGDIISRMGEEFRVLSSFVLTGKVMPHLNGVEMVRVRQHGKVVVFMSETCKLVRTAEQVVAERLMDS